MPAISTASVAGAVAGPPACLKSIADAGFSHVHWSYQWNTDYIYARSEIAQVAAWLDECGLKLANVHGSQGVEKDWCSTAEYRQQSGVELIANRVEMTAALGGGAVVLHMTSEPSEPKANAAYWMAVHRSLDALEAPCLRAGVPLAIENVGPAQPDGVYCFDTIEKVLAHCGPEHVGLCYDSGHGNEAGDGIDRLERVKDRLVAVHLHDNDGKSDQHKLPFTGTVDWPRLAKIIARSSYRGPVTLESSMRNSGIVEPKAFLAAALEAAGKLEQMIRR